MTHSLGSARPNRASDLVAALIARPLLFLFWIVVLWGTLYATSLAYAVAVEGPDSLGRVLSGRNPTLGVVNLVAAALAVVVWGTIGALMAVKWAQRRRA